MPTKAFTITRTKSSGSDLICFPTPQPPYEIILKPVQGLGNPMGYCCPSDYIWSIFIDATSPVFTMPLPFVLTVTTDDNCNVLSVLPKQPALVPLPPGPFAVPNFEDDTERALFVARIIGTVYADEFAAGAGLELVVRGWRSAANAVEPRRDLPAHQHPDEPAPGKHPTRNGNYRGHP